MFVDPPSTAGATLGGCSMVDGVDEGRVEGAGTTTCVRRDQTNRFDPHMRVRLATGPKQRPPRDRSFFPPCHNDKEFLPGYPRSDADTLAMIC